MAGFFVIIKLPALMIGVLPWVNAALGSLDYSAHVPGRRPFDFWFLSEFESMLTFVLVIVHGQFHSTQGLEVGRAQSSFIESQRLAITLRGCGCKSLFLASDG